MQIMADKPMEIPAPDHPISIDAFPDRIGEIGYPTPPAWSAKMANLDLRPDIGVLAEHFSGERRVALVPADVRRLGKRAKFTVERCAGAEAGHPDAAYIDAGARIADRLAIVSSAR